MLMTPQNVEWLKLFTPKSTKCRISLKIQKSVRHQGQSCHLDFKLLGICNYLTQNLTARNFLNWFILCMFPIKVARMVLIEARGGGGGYPLPQALSDSPANERWKNMSGLFVVSWIERIKLQYLGGFVFFLPN